MEIWTHRSRGKTVISPQLYHQATTAGYFDDFDDLLFDENLIQLVEFPTWSRIVNNVLLESILDHIYVKDPTLGGGGSNQ